MVQKSDVDIVFEHFQKGNYFIIHKPLMRKINCTNTCYLSYLIDIFKYARTKDLLRSDDLFFCKREKITEDLGYSPAVQRSIERNLIELDLLSLERKDIPAKNYYKINFCVIREYIEDDKALHHKEIPVHEVKEVRQAKEKKKEEDKAAYETVLNVIEYLNKAIGTDYKPYGTKTAGTVLQWLHEKTELLNGDKRFLNFDDFKNVIDAKVEQWGNNPSFRKNLAPFILFRKPKNQEEIAPFLRYIDELAIVDVAPDKIGTNEEVEWFSTEWRYIKDIPAMSIDSFKISDKTELLKNPGTYRAKIHEGIISGKYPFRIKEPSLHSYIIPDSHKDQYSKKELQDRIARGYYPERVLFTKGKATECKWPSKLWHLLK
jgi:uncharacterized phage protein (TIGR02220 family)